MTKKNQIYLFKRYFYIQIKRTQRAITKISNLFIKIINKKKNEN